MTASWKSERSGQGKKAEDKRAQRCRKGKLVGVDRGDLLDCRHHEERQVGKKDTWMMGQWDVEEVMQL